MSGLEGADLALAVARVMGKDAYGLEDSTCWVREDYFDAANHHHVLAQEFRPDLGGVAGAEVLEWLTNEASALDYTISFEWWMQADWLCQVNRIDGGGISGIERSGPTVWLALCRAVVAWGER